MIAYQLCCHQFELTSVNPCVIMEDVETVRFTDVIKSQIGLDEDYAIQSMNVVELKHALELRGEKKTGIKSDLVERLRISLRKTPQQCADQAKVSPKRRLTGYNLYFKEMMKIVKEIKTGSERMTLIGHMWSELSPSVQDQWNELALHIE
jgi:hypothetical protein